MTDTEQYLKAVEHYCEGLNVSPGCRGIECKYAEGDEDHQCETSFAWTECDSCGSTLGGDRLPATAILDGEVIDLEICVDCVMFHANGDVPEEPR